jgi:hypothetical protein
MLVVGDKNADFNLLELSPQVWLITWDSWTFLVQESQILVFTKVTFYLCLFSSSLYA